MAHAPIPQREPMMNRNLLPRHRLTGELALGWRRPRPGETDAQPIWPILGASPEGEEDEEEEGGEGAAGEEDENANGGEGQGDEEGALEGADQLGDAGKKALDAMKSRARAERERRKAVEKELADLKAAATKTPKDGEKDVPDVEAIRAEAQQQARTEALRERALDRLEARAARQFANPEDARAFLAGRVEDFIDGGQLDTEAIDEALEDLLKQRPYLGSEQAEMRQRRFKDTGDGGARPGQSRRGQLTAEDLDRMSDAQINKAREEGRLNTLLGRK
jgi:hypothetical protein